MAGIWTQGDGHIFNGAVVEEETNNAAGGFPPCI